MESMMRWVLVATWMVVSGVAGEPGTSRGLLQGLMPCAGDEHPLHCTGGRLLDYAEDSLDTEMTSWGVTADAEVRGRQLGAGTPAGVEAPSQAAQRLQLALTELADLLQNSLYKTMARKKGGGGGGIESITITAGQEEMHKKKHKKKKPSNVHLHQHQPAMMEGPMMEMDKGAAEEQGDGSPAAWERHGAAVTQAWVRRTQQSAGSPGVLGDPTLDPALQGDRKVRIKRGGEEARDIGDERGKKKKKKKAILKLLLLGAVLKAKIGLLLQLLSAHLQVKFFAIALAGLAINIARFWLDLKKGHQPQKVIYYEHAQHQHHYEHDEDAGWGGGGWARSINSTPSSVQEDIFAEAVPASNSDELPYGGWFGRASKS